MNTRCFSSRSTNKSVAGRRKICGVNEGLIFVEDSPWGSAAHQGIRMSASLLPRLKSFAEKRHQSLLPYHPVVRFRGLGGPGEAWSDEVFAVARPVGVTPVAAEIAAALEILATKGKLQNPFLNFKQIHW
jgi:hypothetical protein